jgi:Transcription factor WhiB
MSQGDVSLSLLAFNKENWMSEASCKGKTHVMFPKEHKDITYIVDARALCAECPVQPQCLEYALEFPAADMHGVWAGLTSRQLAAEQRRRGIRPTRPTLAQMWGE